jgi:hypothetical protein
MRALLVEKLAGLENGDLGKWCRDRPLSLYGVEDDLFIYDQEVGVDLEFVSDLL